MSTARTPDGTPLVAGWLERDGKYAGYYTISEDGTRCVHCSAAHGLTVEEHEEAAEDG